jgi:predicted nucleotidyltransferase
VTIARHIEVPAEAVRELCDRYQVKALYVFGSAARDDLKPKSDIDVMVEFQPNHTIGLFEFGDLEKELSELLGRKVDLVSKRGLNRHRAPSILTDARLIHEA